MKRILNLILVLLLLLSLSIPVSAADTSRSYEFDLSVNGGDTVRAKPGEIITVTLRLKRTDRQEPALMYAMQDEINYDSTFFELVEGGSIASAGIETKDLALRDHFRAFYMNFVDMSGGKEWNADTMIGTFQLKVIGQRGSSVISNENCLVSTKDGSDSFSVSVKDVTVIVTTDCTVHFETNGGSELADVVVEQGQKLEKPKDPTKEGFRLEGWYKDIDLQQPWDFDSDIVQGNMTLYAKWVPSRGPGGMGSWLWIFLAVILLLILFRKKKYAFLSDKKS